MLHCTCSSRPGTQASVEWRQSDISGVDGYQSVPERHGKGYGGRRGQPPLMSWLLSVIYIVYGTVVLITVECNIL